MLADNILNFLNSLVNRILEIPELIANSPAAIKNFFKYPKLWVKEYVSGRNAKYYVLVVKSSLFENKNYIDKFSIGGFTHFSKYYTQVCGYRYLSKEEAEKDIAAYLTFIKNGAKAIPTTSLASPTPVKKKTTKPRAARKPKSTPNADTAFAELAAKVFESQVQDPGLFVTKTITKTTTTKPRKSKKIKSDDS